MATMVAPTMDWAKEVETATSGARREETFVNGIRTITEYKDEKVKVGETTYNEHVKVTSTFRVEVKRVPKIIAERKKWKKFGQCAKDPPGPNPATTYVSEEIKTAWKRTSSGEAIMGDVDQDGMKPERSAGTAHCHLCKGKDHWSVQCPFRDQLKGNEEDMAEEPAENGAVPVGSSGGAVAGGKYVPPSQRAGAVTTGMMEVGRRSDENTLRITNLPPHTTEDDLRELVTTALSTPSGQNKGRTINRLFLAKNKTTNQCKGFAFVTFNLYTDAASALQILNDHKYEHCVLKVEWSQAR
jgi:translation initiation factor 3 subunit G